MRFDFEGVWKGSMADWCRCSIRLDRDLEELTHGGVPEGEVREYLTAMIRELRPVGEKALFLMYDEPGSMPGDARVDFVYMPTYFAAAILMTAMNRYPGIAADETICKAARRLLQATMGRSFRGFGYDGDGGFLDTLEVFARGDTVEFLHRYPEINPEFTIRFREALEYLEGEICTGRVTCAWTGRDYSERGKKVLERYTASGL